MWGYCCGEDRRHHNTTQNIVLFDYQNSLTVKSPITFLNGYSNYLQVDGYIAYEKTEAMLPGCMAHARRKFIDVKTAQGKNKTGKANDLLVDSYLQTCLIELAKKPENLAYLLPWNIKKSETPFS